MNLVVIQNRTAVTSSLVVAEQFGKMHKDVLESIDKLIKDTAEFSAYSKSPMFFKSEYKNEQNKQNYRMYYMNRDGFTLLTMGYTGAKALGFKMAYINKFNEMEEQLKSPVALTEREKLQLVMKVTEEAHQRLDEVEQKINSIEENQRMTVTQEYEIKEAGQKRVIKVLGGVKSEAYKNLSRSMFQSMWSDFKKHFKLPRYNELRSKDFENGLYFIEKWQPETSKVLLIEELNTQMKLF